MKIVRILFRTIKVRNEIPVDIFIREGWLTLDAYPKPSFPCDELSGERSSTSEDPPVPMSNVIADGIAT